MNVLGMTGLVATFIYCEAVKTPLVFLLRREPVSLLVGHVSQTAHLASHVRIRRVAVSLVANKWNRDVVRMASHGRDIRGLEEPLSEGYLLI